MYRDVWQAVGFIFRDMTVPRSSIQAFFRRMAPLFLIAGASELVSLLPSYTSRTGATWTDITWCAPYLFVTVIAATWSREEEALSQGESSRFRAIFVSQALPILIPLLVLFMGHSIAAEQSTIAWIAVTASFILSAARLVLTNEKQRRIAKELLLTEQALSHSEHMFSTAFRSSPDAIGISAVPGGQFLEVNDSFTRLTGYSHDETLGRTPLELNLWKDSGRRAEVMAKLQRESEVRDEEFICLTKHGETRIGQFSGTLVMLDGKLCARAIA